MKKRVYTSYILLFEKVSKIQVIWKKVDFLISLIALSNDSLRTLTAYKIINYVPDQTR
jgi:hypothetical protein